MGELARRDEIPVSFPTVSKGWANGILPPHMAMRALAQCDHLPKLGRALNEVLTRDVDTGTFPAGQDAEWIFDRFVNTLTQSARAIGLSTLVGSMGGRAEVSRLTSNAEQLRLAAEGASLADTDGLTFGGRALTTVELFWYERVTLNFLEDSIGGSTPEDVIGDVVLSGFAEQLSRLAIEGEDVNADLFYGTLDGWMIDAIGGGATSLAAADVAFTNVTTFGEFLDKLWSKFATPGQYMEDLIFLANADSLKRLEIESRAATGESDVATRFISNGLIGRGFNGERVFGQSRGLAGDQLWRTMLTSQNNLVTSIGRDMRVDVKYEPRQRAFDYIVTSRISFGVRDPSACILGIPPAAIQGSGVPVDGP